MEEQRENKKKKKGENERTKIVENDLFHVIKHERYVAYVLFECIFHSFIMFIF